MRIAVVVLAASLCLALLVGYLGALSASPHQAVAPGETATIDRERAERRSTPELINAAHERGEINERERLIYLSYALSDFEQLPVALHGSRPWSGTAVLLELEQAVNVPTAMSSPAVITAVQGVLSGRCDPSTTALSNVLDSEHFRLEYETIAGGLSIDDYAAALETAWQREIDEFGWARPPVFAKSLPGDRYHIRVVKLNDPTLFGYTSPLGSYAGFVGDNPNSAWDDVDAYASCMVLSNDLGQFGMAAQRMLDGTAAHEFSHAIHYGYGALHGSNRPDESFIEGSANWIMDEVFDESNAGNSFLWPDFERCMGAYVGDPYYYWFTFRGLTEPFGSGISGGGEQVMQDFWELTSQDSESSTMLSALNEALENKGTNLADAFHAYAISLRFNKPCPIGEPYCFEEANAYASVAPRIEDSGFVKYAGDQYEGILEDHYAINYVELPYEGSYEVALENRSMGGEFRVSIVADMGNSGLAVTPFPQVVTREETVTLPAFSVPEGARSVVAVISNQQQTSDNPESCEGHSYLLRTEAFAEFRYQVLLPVIERN